MKGLCIISELFQAESLLELRYKANYDSVMEVKVHIQRGQP